LEAEPIESVDAHMVSKRAQVLPEGRVCVQPSDSPGVLSQ